jgi:hypothetical protein
MSSELFGWQLEHGVTGPSVLIIIIHLPNILKHYKVDLCFSLHSFPLDKKKTEIIKNLIFIYMDYFNAKFPSISPLD